MDCTERLLMMRDNLGVDNARYTDECAQHGRCPQHLAYEPDYCPVCGTANRIGQR